jgi:formylglycine-generating enzyme required for sulfatase activity
VAVTVNTALVAPAITTYPADQSVVAGNAASFSVVATGSAPLSYQWKLNGSSVGSNSASYTSSSSLAVGSYPVTVTVTNAAGSVTSNAATLTVTAAPVAPSITTQPSAQSVTVGDPVTLTVAASGTAPLSYQWYSGTSSTTVTTLIPGASLDFYTPSTASAGTTYYAVTVSNGTGTPATSSPVAVTVSAAPVAPSITTPPGSLTVTEGQPATFTVAATGSATLSYQWQENGVNVGTDSATYTFALPLNSHSGDSITVTVSNAAGSATSTAVTLTVNPLLVTLASSMPLNLTPIAAGTFTMGSPASDPDYVSDETQHKVTISQNFYMGTCLVTQAQWQEVMGNNPSHFTGDLQRPVELVSWNDIATTTTSPAYTCFLDRLNAEMSTICPNCPSGYVFRLPTEAEWEYACRAGTTTRFYWGDYTDSDTTIKNFAWYNNNSGNTTHPVGMLLPNAWGLYDMAGNVWEWCQDWYGSYDSGPDTDPVGPTSGSFRVYRGDGWANEGDFCRSAFRVYHSPVDSYYDLGFRVVLAPPRTP